MNAFEVFEFIHPDGSVKTWAYRITPVGEVEVRYGPEQRLSQLKIYPSTERRKVMKTADAKIRKGYRHIGPRQLDGFHHVVPKPSAPVGRPAVVNQAVPDVTPPPPRPRVPAFDLSTIETDVPDFGWF